MNSGYFDILILAVVAGFIIYRFFGVLGKDVGYKSDDTNQEEKKEGLPLSFIEDDKASDKKEQENTKDHRQKQQYDDAFYDQEVGKKCLDIYQDRTFSAYDFLKSAKKAFEMINEAFADADYDVLEMLLNKDVFDLYKEDIEDYKKNNYEIDYVFIGFDDATIVDVQQKGSSVLISVEFVSRQVFAVLDEQGNVVDGDKEKTRKIKDTWMFERALDSASPVWLVTQTHIDA